LDKVSNDISSEKENPKQTVGLIAGSGKLPLIAARRAGALGYRVVVCAIFDEADPEIEKVSDLTLWVKLGELGRVIRFFRKEGAGEVLLGGKIHKVSLFSGKIKPDFEMVKAVASVRDWKDDSLLLAVVGHLEKNGIRILESTAFLHEDFVPSGVMTKSAPSKQESSDIEFGWTIAKTMGGLDIGQTLVVKSRAVLAVEAIEGTDEAIRRGGMLGGSGAVVIKVSKPKQDMRFDVPVVGPDTLRAMREIRARVLALEAGKTLLLEKDEVLALANEAQISIVAR